MYVSILDQAYIFYVQIKWKCGAVNMTYKDINENTRYIYVTLAYVYIRKYICMGAYVSFYPTSHSPRMRMTSRSSSAISVAMDWISPV